jgi:hypothetical protein
MALYMARIELTPPLTNLYTALAREFAEPTFNFPADASHIVYAPSKPSPSSAWNMVAKIFLHGTFSIVGPEGPLDVIIHTISGTLELGWSNRNTTDLRTIWLVGTLPVGVIFEVV